MGPEEVPATPRTEPADDPPLWHSFLAGATSGFAARVVTFPADTLKARLQLRGAVADGPGATAGARLTYAAARSLWAAAGPAGFYRGFGAILWGVIPANLAYFGGYEAGKRVLQQQQQQWGMAGDMATGAFAQVLAGVVYTPIDIVKERMQVQDMMRGAYSYASPLAAFRSLLQGGQGLAGLFLGYWATNCVWLPWNALYIAGYEQLRRSSCAVLRCPDPQALPAWAVAGCSAAAAAAAAVATHPFDVVKTRLQVLSAAAALQPAATGGGSRPPRLTALVLARRQLAREGARSFFNGLTARLLNIAPGCALSWALYEQMKAWLGRCQA